MTTAITTLPSTKTVTDLVQRLATGLESLDAAGDAPELGDLRQPVGGFLRDDNDAIIGAIVLDFLAAVELGGELMMTPVGGREDLLDEGQLDEFARDAVGEVINVLTTTVNVTAENPRVRSSAPTDLAAMRATPEGAWMAEDHDRADFLGEFKLGTGRLVFLGRRG